MFKIGIKTLIAATLAIATLLLVSPAFAQNLVANGSFEDDVCPAWPGYGAITDWSCTTGTYGLNTLTNNNFANNGAVPDGVNVAFIQVNPVGTYTSASMSQTISGLQQGATYLLTYYENSASMYPGIPSLNVTIGSATVIADHVVNPVGAYETFTSPYTFVQTYFTVPASGSYVLSFNTSDYADGAVLLDNVSIIQVPPSTNLVLNGDFDIDACPAFPGYGNITDWPCTIGTHGLNTETNNNFANNGAVPSAPNVAFMQTGSLGTSASLYQTINGLQQNVYYVLTYYENSASSYPGIPSLNVTIGSQTLVPNHVVNPVGAYETYSEFLHVGTELLYGARRPAVTCFRSI